LTYGWHSTSILITGVPASLKKITYKEIEIILD